MAEPILSVVVPVHNAGPYLAECLAALKAQTLTGLEIIAVDDGSTDGSSDELARAARAGGLRLVSQRPARGPSSARNAGLSVARGTWVAFVDADDTVAPEMYETMLAAARPGVEVVSCGLQLTDESGRPRERVPFPLPPARCYDHEALHEELHSAFGRHLLWYPVRSLYSRELLTRIGLRFDEGIRKGEDSVFNLRALDAATGLAVVPDCLYRYRKHPASATARPLADEAGNVERLGGAISKAHAAGGFDVRAIKDFQRQVLASDLPTALVRLRRTPDLLVQVRRLLATEVVQQALTTQNPLTLPAPLRVRALLVLCRLGLVRLVVALLRRL